MTSALSATILLLLGIALTKLGVSDDLLLYVRASARPWVLSAGLAMTLLALWSLVAALRRQQPAGRVHAQPHDHHRPGRSAWLVLAPVIALLIVAPPALGAFTARRAAPASAVAGRHAALDPGASAVSLSMFDLYLLAGHSPAALRGRTVSVIGFADGSAPQGFVLARLVITCCAADAFSVTTHVITRAPTPPSNSWVRVTGIFAGRTGDGTPMLRASTVAAIPAPANPYD